MVRKSRKGLSDELLERDVTVLLCEYLKSNFIIEAIANLPILVYEFYLGFPRSTDFIHEQEDNILYTSFMFLKIFRLFHISQSLESIEMIRSIFVEIFYMKRYMLDQIQRWTLTGIKFVMIIHFYTCGWILIYYYKVEEGIETFEFS